MILSFTVNVRKVEISLREKLKKVEESRRKCVKWSENNKQYSFSSFFLIAII
jgi:hypothetical protein